MCICLINLVSRNLRTVVSVPDLQQSRRIWASHRPEKGVQCLFQSKIFLFISTLIFIDYKYNILFNVLRSASVTNLSLDRSGSSMVPAYESSVSPQNSRALSKIDHSEEERKILLVTTVFYRFLLNFTSLSSCYYNSWLSCRILLNLKIYGRKFATTVQEWSSRTTGTGCALTPTALWVKSWSTGFYEMALFQLGKNQ